MHFPASNNIISQYYEHYDSLWPPVRPMKADVPAASFLTLGIEREFDQYRHWALYFRQTWVVPLVVSLFYCLAVHLGQRMMLNRGAFDLRRPLAIWNFFLALFSIIGTIRVVPYFVYTLYVNGPVYFLCRPGTGSYAQDGEVSFWFVLFALSKYAELIDTVFLVLRKKPVPFLHWYHHATVLLISIHSLAVDGPSGAIMMSMNIVVHSVMYTYYFLAAVMHKPPRWGRFVTTIQIVQMILGSLMALALCLVNHTSMFRVENCYGVPSNNATIAIIYTSYLVLFLQFYAKRYEKPTKKSD
jgi:hypothetical protein